jgi:hypothetical protein
MRLSNVKISIAALLCLAGSACKQEKLLDPELKSPGRQKQQHFSSCVTGLQPANGANRLHHLQDDQ